MSVVKLYNKQPEYSPPRKPPVTWYIEDWPHRFAVQFRDSHPTGTLTVRVSCPNHGNHTTIGSVIRPGQAVHWFLAQGKLPDTDGNSLYLYAEVRDPAGKLLEHAGRIMQAPMDGSTDSPQG